MSQKPQIINLIEDNHLHDIVTIFRALSDPTRLQVISILTDRSPLCVSDIAQQLNMSISRISHHLSMLEKLGFAKYRQEGKQVFYSIADDCIIDIIARAQEHVRGK